MRSHRDVAAQTNLDAARRLVRSLVGVQDVAFRTDAAGRIDGVAVLPAQGAHERQVRLNVASGLMAGFGVALDPMKIEVASAPEALRAIEADAAAEPLARASAPSPDSVPSQVDRPAQPEAAVVRPAAVPPYAEPAAGNATPRPALRPRVSEVGAGLAARAFQSMHGDSGRAAPPAVPEDEAPPQHVPEDAAESPSVVPSRDEPAPARRVRLVDDDPFGPPREPAQRESIPDVRPFPAMPADVPASAAAASNGTGQAHTPHHAGNGRVAAAYVPNGRAAAALALPVVEPASAPMQAPPRVEAAPAGMPSLELAEVVATSGATFCRVVVVVDGESYTGVAEVAGRDGATLETIARITTDALRSARVPRTPIQFHGANTVDVGGRAYVVAVLRAWNGRAFDDLTAVEPVAASPEEAVALAVLRAAASRID